MPGVPSGRGCDACRRQKKKCDIAKFPCPRCKRLDISCTGLGQQRFKFKDENERLAVVNSNQSIRSRKPAVAMQPSRSLTNPLSRLTGAFVEKIGPSLDIRFQLLWSFGDYLADVPRHLGTSAALDAAADALVTAHARFCNREFDADSTLLAKHSRALSILRHDLNDPVKAHSSQTLCSIMLLMIYQTLTRSNRTLKASHTEGAACILKGRGYFGPRDEFETKLLLALRGPVVVEALVQDHVLFTPQEWKDLVMHGIDGTNVNGRMLYCLARVPDILKRCREVLPRKPVPGHDWTELKEEVDSFRQACKAIIQRLHDRLQTVNISLAPLTFKAHTHAHHLCIYSMGLATGIIFNSILGMFESDSIRLHEESSHYSNEIFQSAESAVEYQPLGSLAMVLFLGLAWLGASTPAAKERVRTLLFDYRRACLGSSESEMNADLEWLTMRFTSTQACGQGSVSNLLETNV